VHHYLGVKRGKIGVFYTQKKDLENKQTTTTGCSHVWGAWIDAKGHFWQ